MPSLELQMLTEDHDLKHKHGANVTDAPDAAQDRRGCCGTMNNPEYWDVVEDQDDEIQQIKKSMGRKKEKHAAS